MLDLHNKIVIDHALTPAAAGTTGTGRSSDIIDRKGYDGVEFAMHYGVAAATGYAVAVIVKEGDATGAMTSVADADLLGTEALAGLAIQATSRTSGVGQNVAKRIGYKGLKRYVQVDMVNTGAATGITGATIMLYNPEAAPTTNP
jgi:hypothetical protein